MSLPRAESLRSWLKLTFGRAGIRARHFESCFGAHPEKYEEFFRWFDSALQLDGDVLEFGVYLGGTTCLMAERVLAQGCSKTIYAFDSFCGFREDEFDACFTSGDVTQPMQKHSFRHSYDTLAYVQRKLRVFGFSPIVRIRAGFFQDSLNPFLAENPRQRFCFSLIDCDLASSVKFCAERVYDRLLEGGIILFDDYGSLTPGKPDTAYSPGVRKVVRDFVEAYPSRTHGYTKGLYHFVK